MKHILYLTFILCSLSAISQSDSTTVKPTYTPSAHPYSIMVRRLIQMDTVSLAHYHHRYVAEMTSGTALVGGGVLVLIGHILSAVLPTRINKPVTIALGTVGSTAMLSGAVVLTIGGINQIHFRKAKRLSPSMPQF